MRVLHKTSQSHPDTYLTRPYGSRCYAREKAPVHRSNVPSSVHFPKYCAGFCLQIHQPLFTLYIRVKKVRKGNYRKHNFSKKKKNYILWKLENSGSQLLWTRVLKIKIHSQCVFTLQGHSFYLKFLFSLHCRAFCDISGGKPVVLHENKKQKPLDSSLFLLLCSLQEVT